MKLTRTTLGLYIVTLMTASTGVLAHVQNGAVGSARGATDIFSVYCPEGDDSVRLEAQVNDVTPVKPPLLQLKIEKVGKPPAIVVDPKDGDRKYSPSAVVQGGTGAYTVSVSKIASGRRKLEKTRGYPERYVLQYHCKQGDSHPETEIRYEQNQ